MSDMADRILDDIMRWDRVGVWASDIRVVKEELARLRALVPSTPTQDAREARKAAQEYLDHVEAWKPYEPRDLDCYDAEKICRAYLSLLPPGK